MEYEPIHYEVSGKYGLPLHFAVKETAVFDVLGRLAAGVAERGLNIVFKGGTALNKVYLGELQRFSEDLDFDFITQKADEAAIGQLKQLMAGVSGFEIAGPWRFRRTIRFHCLYQIARQKDLVRVEFRLMERRKTASPVAPKTAVSTYYGRTVAGVPTYSLDDLIAGKLSALASRCEGRDVWDVFNALDRTVGLKKAVAALQESEGERADAEKLIRQALERVRKADAQGLKKLTNPLIPLSNRPDWRELLDSLAAKLERLLEKPFAMKL